MSCAGELASVHLRSSSERTRTFAIPYSDRGLCLLPRCSVLMLRVAAVLYIRRVHAAVAAAAVWCCLCAPHMCARARQSSGECSHALKMPAAVCVRYRKRGDRRRRRSRVHSHIL